MTQVALVDVNGAVINGARAPRVAKGNINSPVPTKITIKKPSVNSLGKDN